MNKKLSKKIRFDLKNHPAGHAGESLWADLIMEDLYEVRNIPIFTYGVNYLDLVKVEETKSGILQATEVVKKSNHRTIRVFFIDGKSSEENYRRLMEFKGLGIGSEKWNDGLYALNVTPERNYEAFIAVLNELQEKEILEYELSGEWRGNFDGTEKC